MNFHQSQTQNEALIRFIVATDNHLGANENMKDNRGQDTYEAFEEILKLAEKNKADFLLLGGDLFHEKRPSEHCLLKCVDILQRYVFGNSFGGISLQENTLNYKPNFSSSNFNIQLPIFIINGNHDNFITEQDEHVSILDILHESKYLNYFGKVTNQSQVNVHPLIINKGGLKIALYGIGYIKDYQFSKLLANEKVFLDDLDPSNFNILVIHQNRYKGTHFQEDKDFLDPIQFRRFKINLLIWGHEHEAKYQLEQIEHFHVFQCGSSVATSIIEAEGIVKQAGFFTLAPQGMQFQSLKLTKSHRPIILKSVELSELVKKGSIPNETAQDIVERKLFDLVEGELRKYYAESPYRHKKPLVRFKVEYSGFEILKIRYLENKFCDKVANPERIFQFWEKKQHLAKKLEQRQLDVEKMNQDFERVLTNKNYKVDNEQMLSDCTYLIKSKLKEQHFQIVNPGDFLGLLDMSKKQEKGNVFEILQNQLIQRQKQGIMPAYSQQLEMIVKQQREQENKLQISFKDKMLKNFIGQGQYEIEEDKNYELCLSKHYDELYNHLRQFQQLQGAEQFEEQFEEQQLQQLIIIIIIIIIIK